VEFIQPDYTTQSGTAYPLAIDAAVAALKNATMFMSLRNNIEMSNPKNFALNAIMAVPAFGNALVAVGAADGTDAYIVTLTGPFYETATWTERSNPKNFALNDVAWSGDAGSLIVAVGAADGTDAYIVTSPTGTSWTERSNPKNFALNAVHGRVGTALVVAVGAADGTDAYIITSTDAVSWTERSNPKNFALNDIVWSEELSLWVAVGAADGTDAYIVTSPNGTTWTERANPKNVTLNAVAWSPELGLLVAVGQNDGTDAYVITSPDGITWTERACGKASTALNDVIWCGQNEPYSQGRSYFLAVGAASGTAGRASVSFDGLSWTDVDITMVFGKDAVLNGVLFEQLVMLVGSSDGADAYIVRTLRS